MQVGMVLVKRAPPLYSEVIEEAKTLMDLSIQQALAGPLKDREKWLGEPVSKFLQFIVPLSV